MMSQLNDFFRQNSYTLHRNALRRERLPACCRSGDWRPTHRGIRFLGTHGEEVILPLVRCEICGRQYAEVDGKYFPADNPLQFDLVNIH